MDNEFNIRSDVDRSRVRWRYCALRGVAVLVSFLTSLLLRQQCASAQQSVFGSAESESPQEPSPPSPVAVVPSARHSVDEVLAIRQDAWSAEDEAVLREEGLRLWRAELERRHSDEPHARPRAAHRRGRRDRSSNDSGARVPTGGFTRVITGPSRMRCTGTSTGIQCGNVATDTEVDFVFDPTIHLCGDLQGEILELRDRAEQLTPIWADGPRPGSTQYNELHEIRRRQELLRFEVEACESQAWAEYEAALRGAGDRCARWTRYVQQWRVISG